MKHNQVRGLFALCLAAAPVKTNFARPRNFQTGSNANRPLCTPPPLIPVPAVVKRTLPGLPHFLLPLLLLLLTLPAVVQAEDYTYTTNNGTITITGYTGPGGDLTIPSTITGLPVTRIGDSAFQYNTNLTSVTMGNSVTSIGGYAFTFCTSLTNVTIPASVTSIGGEAFHYCGRLSSITVDALNSVYSSVDGVLFNQSQTAIIQYPVGKAGSTYTIPNSVTSIGDAFESCPSLTSVTIPNSVTNIGYFAFYNCPSLANVTIPSSVASIGDYAFSYCPSLTSITIPNSVTSIGDSVFQNNTSLTSVTIGNGVTVIGNETFAGCSSLISVMIPNSVFIIGGYAFGGCTSLTSIMIPESVTYLGAYAFASCGNLTGVYFQGNAPDAGEFLFEGDDNATVYYLPGTTGWGTMYGGPGSHRPTALWKPLVQTSDASFGVRTNQFGFNITWANDMVIVVEACTNLANPIWSPLQTNTLSGDSFYFSEPQWTNYPARFYRLRSP